MEDRGEMMETDDWKHPGRRGLFMVTEEEKNQPDTKETTGDYSEIVAKLLTYTNGEFPKVPDAFVPILNRLKQDADTLFETEQNLVKISKELEKLKEEQDSIKRKHESYLSDLISAHTEFADLWKFFSIIQFPWSFWDLKSRYWMQMISFVQFFQWNAVKLPDSSLQYQNMSRMNAHLPHQTEIYIQ
jgi:hypothetical protein